MERATRYWLSLTLIGISLLLAPRRGRSSAHSLAVYSRPIRRAIGSSVPTVSRCCFEGSGSTLACARRTRWRDISVGGRGGSKPSRTVDGEAKAFYDASAPSRTRSGAVTSDNEAGRD